LAGFFKWPGHVVPGSEVDQPTSLLDMLPTLGKEKYKTNKYKKMKVYGFTVLFFVFKS
jgi:arylsulfatase A-like enzyme